MWAAAPLPAIGHWEGAVPGGKNAGIQAKPEGNKTQKHLGLHD